MDPSFNEKCADDAIRLTAPAESPEEIKDFEDWWQSKLELAARINAQFGYPPPSVIDEQAKSYCRSGWMARARLAEV